MKNYNTLEDFDFENKTVLLRVDFNMPLDKNTLEILELVSPHMRACESS